MNDVELCLIGFSIRVLKALEEHNKEREKEASISCNSFKKMAVSREKEGWKKFWDANSLKLLLYSCQYGTVEIVKYFITRHVPPTIW